MRAATAWIKSRIARVTAVAALAGAGLAGAGLSLGSADAATPTQGTVTDTSTSVSWTGGPFVVPNVTATATGTPTCTLPTDCDDLTLHVSTPAGYGTTLALTIKVAWPTTAADFDVYVLDKAGNVVGTSASSADPELVILPPTTGDYTVRVVPFAPLGQSYSASAILATVPANPAPGTDTPPSFATYAAPSSLKDANNAGEPSIGTSFNSGSTFFQSYRSTYQVRFDDSASPTKATWRDVSANAANGCFVGSTAAWTRSCSPTTRPAAPSSRSSRGPTH